MISRKQGMLRAIERIWHETIDELARITLSDTTGEARPRILELERRLSGAEALHQTISNTLAEPESRES